MALIRGKAVALPAAEKAYWMKYFPAMTSVLLPGMTSVPQKVSHLAFDLAIEVYLPVQ